MSLTFLCVLVQCMSSMRQDISTCACHPGSDLPNPLFCRSRSLCPKESRAQCQSLVLATRERAPSAPGLYTVRPLLKTFLQSFNGPLAAALRHLVSPYEDVTHVLSEPSLSSVTSSSQILRLRLVVNRAQVLGTSAFLVQRLHSSCMAVMG